MPILKADWAKVLEKEARDAFDLTEELVFDDMPWYLRLMYRLRQKWWDTLCYFLGHVPTGTSCPNYEMGGTDYYMWCKRCGREDF